MILYVPLLKSCTSQRSLLPIHARLLVTGLHRNALLSTKLIESYAKIGTVCTARWVFDAFSAPDPFMWAVMIKSYVWNLHFREAVSLYHHGIYYHRFALSGFVFSPVLNACAGLRYTAMGKKVHGRVVQTGFESDVVVATSLVRLYGDCGSLEDAYRVFNEMPERDVVSWNLMISSCIRCGQASTGLTLFCEMISENVEHDSVMMLTVLDACASIGALRNVKAVHGNLLRRLTEIDGSVENSLVATYSRCGDLDSAETVFGTACKRSVILWTTMISSYNQRGCFEEALDVFTQMLNSEVEPNSVTMIGVLFSCTQLGLPKEGKSVHGFSVRIGADPHLASMGSALITMYSSFRKLVTCWNVFAAMEKRTLLSWNSLITACAQNGCWEDALELFIRMRSEGLLPDSFTLANALSASACIGELSFGEQVYGVVTKTGFDISTFVQNSLIDMFCRCGVIDTALKMFKEVERKDVITWNAMINGLSQNGRAKEAIQLFDRMHDLGLEMDSITFLNAIKACTCAGSLVKGKLIHHKLVTSGLRDDKAETGLVDMYAKCGDIAMAKRVFDSIPVKNVVSWSSIISGYGNHGMAGDAVALFSRMVLLGVRPNEVTFTAVLSACSHAGLVEEGLSYFCMMKEEYGIDPQQDHYVLVVDLLSRAGQIDRAFDFITTMSTEPSATTWRALLNGCHIHHRQDMAVNIQNKILIES